MSARRCFLAKVRANRVSQRAGTQVLDMLNAFEAEYQNRLGDAAGARQAALDAAAIAKSEAARKADEARGSAIAQANVLRTWADYDARVKELRATPGDFNVGNKAPPTLGKEGQTTLGFAARSLLARDVWEIGSDKANVDNLWDFLRGRAHAAFADAIEFLRPKGLGFKPEATRELDVLRALYGRTDVDPQARVVAQAWQKVADRLADDFIGAGGKLAKRENWRLGNPSLDPTKVQALGYQRFSELVRDVVNRDEMLDFDTGKPMNDARFEQLLNEAYNSIINRGRDGLPSGQARGRTMLANSRDVSRLFVLKDAESWMRFAEAAGEHASIFETMTQHISAMARDTAMMRVLGPNPEATRRFILDLFDREAGRLGVTAATDAPKEVAAAARANRATEARVRLERRVFEDLWAETTGANRVPVNTTLANAIGDVRSLLSAAQLGSALISSLSDPGTAAVAARFNGLPVMNVISRAVSMMGEKGSEIFAAQQGVVLDTLAHAAGAGDRILGEEIRSGIAAKISSANIRLSGLRRWTGVLRAAFGLEFMAHVARERGTALAELEPRFRQALERYGIGETEWDAIRNTAPHEPRPGAPFLRPMDVAEGGTATHQAAAEKFNRMITTEMDYAVIEGDPVTRAMLVGSSQPGTAGGEVRRAITMYRSFPATFLTMHFARAVARGWDGSRMGHAALTFLTMMGLGALSMQAKEIAAGRDPLNLNPVKSDGTVDGNGLRAWGKAILQGGGLGVFGDVLFVDQTKYGNTWASTVAGPIAGAAETLLGDFVLKNIQLAGKGQETHFLGDALYAGARYVPGSSLWFGRLAFQRYALDQLALMADPRTPQRLQRIEDQARKDWGQSYWWQPGRTEARRAPDLAAIGGR